MATPMMARSSLSNETSSGRNSGSITLDMNRMVISGTPRQNSMNITESSLTIGIFVRRPSANMMPMGSDAAMPHNASTSVTRRPPHSAVSTSRSPKSMPMTTSTTAKTANGTSTSVAGRRHSL